MSIESHEATPNYGTSSFSPAEMGDGTPKVLDFERGSDGVWRMGGSDTRGVGGGRQKSQEEAISPRDRWYAAERREARIKKEMEGTFERERGEEIKNITDMGRELASIVYTPEGQRRVETLVEGLTRVVESTIRRPDMETLRADFLRDQHEVERVRSINEQRMRDWEERVRSRVDRLLSGEPMSNIEQAAYLRLEFDADEAFAQGLYLDREESGQREFLLGVLEREIGMVSAALAYKLHDREPVDKRPFPTVLNQDKLKFYHISAEQAREVFAKGWDEIKDRATSEEVRSEQPSKQ